MRFETKPLFELHAVTLRISMLITKKIHRSIALHFNYNNQYLKIDFVRNGNNAFRSRRPIQFAY